MDNFMSHVMAIVVLIMGIACIGWFPQGWRDLQSGRLVRFLLYHIALLFVLFEILNLYVKPGVWQMPVVQGIFIIFVFFILIVIGTPLFKKFSMRLRVKIKKAMKDHPK